jgi:hypothetical protein
MESDRINDLRAFRSFVDEKLSDEGDVLTLDDALAHWEYANQTEMERAETLQSIRQGLADVESGQTRPFADFDREFRQKRGLPPRE